MLARRLTTILPAMTLAEAIETTRIHRVAGLTGDRTALVTTRPCRAPHHTISAAGLIGGGRVSPPGAASACLRSQASWDRHATAWPRTRRCPLRVAVENHDNAGATAGDGRNIPYREQLGRAMGRLTATQILIALTIALLCAPVASADLRSYVKADDQAYRWEHLMQTDRSDGTTVHELRVISQVWQGITWQHRLRIVIPQAPQNMPSLTLLIINGSHPAEQELREAVFMARQLNAPVAILSDIPNQPLFGGLVEDDLLAHTFVQYIATQDTTWPLLLPMVKGVVRAMDAMQAFMPRQLNAQVSGFLLSGASKRGWTVWLTPAVDDRVRGIAPLVYDNLDLARQMQHQRETWGHFSGQIAEYVERGLPQRLLRGEKAAVELAAIVDPFRYRQQLTVPKLIVLGTNDRYWPLDALNLYYDALIGERYILYMPNAGHELRSGRERTLTGLMAFFQHLAGRRPLPTLRWEATVKERTLTLSITSDRMPRAVRAWVATASTKDFREARWEAFEMQVEPPDYVYRRDKGPQGVTAIFGEAEYEAGTGAFVLTTTIHLFP
jgi:PhoPQ-activated pathogenicity-related protein